MTLHYRNETLFSEIYLEEITRQPEEDHILASLRVLREYRDYADVSSLETWTQSYIHEVFAALGFNHKPKRADLTLLFPMGGTDQPVSLCCVTLPDESLDNTTLGRNWAEKVIRALREQGLQWGLLTNGKSWRIYHVDEATPYETYLEIDLERILAEQAKDAYQIFHKFMKAENFVADNEGKCQFDRFKKESKDKIDYIEKELANALKQREENGKGVLSDLCMGYVDELRQLGGFDLDDDGLRRKIYHGSMLYMFRLLFLFYADARGLLSDENHDLLDSVEADARAQHKGERDGAASYAIWERLAAIFVDIDQTYNGGLFSPQESEFTQFIEETRIADQYLAGTLFNLTTYREKNGEERPISYRDMSVRHLGTLYEGLLEHKLFITQEDTEVRVTKGKIEFIPASQGGKLVQGRFLPEGAVYFGSDPSERKSTGSYYTPEYIVDYITRKTVGEKLNEIKQAFLKQEKGNLSAYSSAVDEDERVALARLLEENALTFVREKILTLSVLDPAMGSGHFLVNVANLISNFITEFLNEMGIEGSADTSPAYWRRWVVENCIYGVDLNPLAVELAKLSLWLLSMAKDQPLSFTNHHLKCGNSLVGARLEEIGAYPFSKSTKEPRQLNMFEKDANFRAAVEDALAKSRLIASHASTTLEDVEEKKHWLAEIENDLDEYKAICDLHTSLYFGSEASEEEYLDIVETRSFTKAKDLTNISYFHWELEFPEIFFSLHGFDCIVGNPPYVRQEKLKELKPYLETFSAYTGGADLFTYFYENALIHSNESGLIAFISSNSYLHTSSGKGLRKLLSGGSSINSIVDFGNIRVFEGADTYVAIIVFSNVPTTREKIIKINKVEEAPGETLAEKIYQHTLLLPQNTLSAEAWNLSDKRLQGILKKIINIGKPLKDVYGVPLSGIKTGANDVLIIDRGTLDKISPSDKEMQLILPFRGGEDIRPWYVENIDQWLIGIPFGWTRLSFPHATTEEQAWQEFSREYPSIAHYLNSHEEILSNRNDQGEFWWELRPCQYWKDLQNIKIVWPQFGKVPRWSMDDKGLYLKNSSYFLATGDYFLLGLLNSKVIWFYISQTCKPMGKRAGLWRYMLLAQYLEKLPIPNVQDDLRTEIENVARNMTLLMQNKNSVDERINSKREVEVLLQRLDSLALAAFKLSVEDYEAISDACPYKIDDVLEISR